MLTEMVPSGIFNHLTVWRHAMKTNPANEARTSALRDAPLRAWIALSDDETKIVARGATCQDVADQLDKAGDATAVVVKTPSQWGILSV
jgi:hypothetical protein